MKIFVIDDEKSITDLLKRFLTSRGNEVSTFNNSMEFLKEFENEKDNIDIVITDIMLPEKSGIELLKIIKEKNPLIVVIMITGYGTVEKAVECLKLGAFDFLEKPFNISAIERIINNAKNIHSINVELSEYKKMNQQLKELDKLKDEFIANTTHELKTPLFAISGAVENIIDMYENLNKDKIMYMLDIIENNTNRLKNLINQILLISKIENGSLVISLEKCSSGIMIDEALNSIKILADKKNIRIVKDYLKEDFIVECDKEKILQVLINLLSNAIKFSYYNSSIIIMVINAENNVTFKIKDFGC